MNTLFLLYVNLPATGHSHVLDLSGVISPLFVGGIHLLQTCLAGLFQYWLLLTWKKTTSWCSAACFCVPPGTAPPVIVQPPETASLSRGNTARFVCNSTGEPSPVLYWLKDGQPVKSFRRVKSQSPGVLLINQLAPEDAGYYQCIADNGLGTACATAKLTVIVREGLPSAPHHLTATPYSSTSALLTWEKPEHNSDQIIGYSVHCQRATGLCLFMCLCTSTFLQYVHFFSNIFSPSQALIMWSTSSQWTTTPPSISSKNLPLILPIRSLWWLTPPWAPAVRLCP